MYNFRKQLILNILPVFVTKCISTVGVTAVSTCEMDSLNSTVNEEDNMELILSNVRSVRNLHLLLISLSNVHLW